jgi:CBS domain-containing protein
MGDSLVLLPRSSLQSARASKNKIRFFSESFRTPSDSFISKNEGMAKGLCCIASSAPENQQRRSAMKVKDVMHKGVDWVSPNTPVTELAKLMREHDIGCIPIGEDDRLIGMVTDRDIVCKGLASNNFDARRAMARDVMTEGIHCCREDDDLAKAVHHMETLKVRRLPVINKSKRMVGMISLGDVSHSAPGDLLSECVKSVSTHH